MMLLGDGAGAPPNHWTVGGRLWYKANECQATEKEQSITEVNCIPQSEVTRSGIPK